MLRIGLLLAGLGGAAALLAHAAVPALSPTLVAILLGLALAATGRIPGSARPGLRVANRQVLRVGVALLGLRLVLADVVGLGWAMLLAIAGVVVLGIAGTLVLGARLGVPPERSLLIACGFSICGAAAVAAVEGVRRSADEDEDEDEDDDVATAVSLVVVFGSVAMLVVPLGALALGFDPVAAGAWSGASVHEVGQVVVAGGLVGGAALQVAVTVKLGRVLLLAPVLAAISYRSRRTTGPRPALVPGFVVAFLLCALLRSTVPVPEVALHAASVAQDAALAAAMFALGCGVDVGVLRRTGAPLLGLAAGATVLVAALGLPAALIAG